MVDKIIIPQTETIAYLNDKFPSYEEFMKTYKSDDKVSASYEAEWQDKLLNGSQYGPGKVDFSTLYKKITNKLGWPTLKISCDSDEYRGSDYNYVGALIYAMDGEFTWKNSCGDALNRNGRSFYTIIRISDSPYWREEVGQQGQGAYHTPLIWKALGYNVDTGYTVCGGGFGCRKGDNLRFSSYPMNGKDKDWGFCKNDSDSTMSYWEQEVVKFIWKKYKVCNGNFNETYHIPYDEVHKYLG